MIRGKSRKFPAGHDTLFLHLRLTEALVAELKSIVVSDADERNMSWIVEDLLQEALTARYESRGMERPDMSGATLPRGQFACSCGRDQFTGLMGLHIHQGRSRCGGHDIVP